MTHFILVHGAFHNAECWNNVVRTLNSAGHTCTALDLPSHGQDSTPIQSVTLETYAAKVVSELRKAPEPPVLVGHSMGGMVITQAADTFLEGGGELKQLVYVTAFVPRNGQSLVDLANSPEGAGDMVQANVVVEGEPPIGRLPDDKAREAFYADCPEDVSSAAVAALDPQPILAFVSPVSIQDDRVIDRRYILTTEDKAIPPVLQRRMTNDTAFNEVVEIASSHSPFLSQPDILSELLIRFSR